MRETTDSIVSATLSAPWRSGIGEDSKSCSSRMEIEGCTESPNLNSKLEQPFSDLSISSEGPQEQLPQDFRVTGRSSGVQNIITNPRNSSRSNKQGKQPATVDEPGSDAAFTLRTEATPSNSPVSSEADILRVQLRLAQAQLDLERKAREKDRMEPSHRKEKCRTRKEEDEQEISELREEIKIMKGAAAECYATDIRMKYKKLKEENDALRKEMAELRENSTDLKQQISYLGAQLDRAKRLEHPKSSFDQTGIRIRIRFLENGRDSVLYQPRNRLDQMSLELGNLAAHGGNGVTDAALFLGGHLSPKQNTTLSPVYQSLYHYEPAEFINLPRSVQDAIDCEATIRTLQSLNDGLDRPLKERQIALESATIIREKYSKIAWDCEAIAAFDTDPGIVFRLAQVKDLTHKIVEYDRQRKGQVAKEKRDSTYSSNTNQAQSTQAPRTPNTSRPEKSSAPKFRTPRRTPRKTPTKDDRDW